MATIEMLKKRDDIRTLLKDGKKKFLPLLSIKYRANAIDKTRFLISCDKKTKGVKRNLLRRRVKEILRLNFSNIEKGFDIAFFLKYELLDLDFKSLSQEILSILNMGKLLMNNG